MPKSGRLLEGKKEVLTFQFVILSSFLTSVILKFGRIFIEPKTGSPFILAV